MADLSNTDTSADAPIFMESHDKTQAERQAVSAEDLLLPNVDPLLAVQAARKALPKLQAMKPRLQSEFTKLDLSKIDKLQDYSFAYAHATTLVRTAEPQDSGFDQLVSECSALRSKFDAFVRAAHEAGAISATRLNELKGTVGHRNIAHDLLLLAQILRANAAKLEGKTLFTAADIRHADALAARLNQALADRDTMPGSFEEANLNRQRAFTLFFRTYAQLRRRVGLLLEEDGLGDTLDEVMPGLLGKNPSGKKRPDDAAATLKAAPSAITQPVHATNGGQAETSARVGMPDSDPFTKN